MEHDKLKLFRLNKMINEVEDYAILLMDINGNIENWNKGAKKLKGYDESEIIGRNFSLFYPEEDRKNGKPQRLIRLAAERGSVSDEGWRVRKDGSRFWGSILITAIHDDDGNIVGFTKVTRDLTSKKQLEEERERHMSHLESRNKEMEWLAYITSHDLQEPLRTISSFFSLFEARYGSAVDEEGKMYINVIRQSAHRMQELIRSVLEYSIIGANRTEGEVNLNDVLAAVRMDLSAKITSSGAVLECGELPVVQGNTAELRQLFQNLISNSIKFCKPEVPPVITITAAPEDEKWLIRVADNGIGIEEKYFDKIFMMFQRLHNREAYPGTGIGLTYAKKIVDLHQGKIWVTSEYGKGTTFNILLNK